MRFSILENGHRYNPKIKKKSGRNCYFKQTYKNIHKKSYQFYSNQ